MAQMVKNPPAMQETQVRSVGREDPLGFSVHGILQARILEWAAIPVSRGSSPPRD